MTIYELKQLHEKSGGYFFSRRTMHFFGDRMKDFSIKKIDDIKVEVTHKGRGKRWLFNSITGRLVYT